jgi:predicted nucleic acid-binding protein
MSELIYIDTNVWISLFKEEKDKLHPISAFSFELFRKSLNCDYNLLISNWLLNEIRGLGYLPEANELLNQFIIKKKINKVYFTNEDIKFAKKHFHWRDRLHEILAKKGNAKYLVTRNIKDFEGDLVEIKFPENL